MFSPKNVIYGFFKSKNQYNNKHKYLISLYIDEDTIVTACVTTSQNRSGAQRGHEVSGANKNSNGQHISYVFKNTDVVGKTLSGDDYTFPVTTTIRYDAHFTVKKEAEWRGIIENPEVVCTLTDKVYSDLIYSMLKSPDVSGENKIIFEGVLTEMGKNGLL